MSLSPSSPDMQAEFDAVLEPILAALPKEVTPQLLGNIAASIVAEFIHDKALAVGIMNFASAVVCQEIDRLASAGAVH